MDNRISHHRIKKGIKPDLRQMLKLTPLYFIPLALLSIGLVIGIYMILVHQDLKGLMWEEQMKLGIKKELIMVEMEAVFGDLFHVREEHELRTFVESKDPGALSNLQQELLSYCSYKKIYDQIRYIDETGMEMARINYRPGASYITPKDRLQNKKNRYYFKETLMMPNGGSYISPFDLNVENGKIEIPIKPVLRFCTPVYRKDGKKGGAVVLNYRGDVLFDRMKTAFADAKYSTWLINDKGYWLYSKNPDMNWGFMYETRKESTFRHKFPNEWNMILKRKEGKFRTEHGLFAFKKIFPLAESIHRLRINQAREDRSVNFFDPDQYYWIIMSHVSSPELAQRNTRLLWISLSLSVLLAFAGAIMAWFFVRNKIVNQLSIAIMEDAARLNDSLMVNSSVISGQLDFSDTLKEALKSAKRLSNAKYGALSVVKNGAADTFLTDGLTDKKVSGIEASMPKSMLLNSIGVDKKPYRLPDLLKHPESCGFPKGHIPMTAFLGVPLIHQGELLGSLYLTKEAGDPDFSEQDEKIVSKLADHMAAVIKKAVMYEELKLGASIFDNSIEGITITDTNGTIVKVNKAFSAITGYRCEDVVGKNPRLLKSNRHDSAFYKSMWDAILQNGKWEGEIWNRRKNGETYPEWLSISAIQNFNGETEHYVAVFHDISEVKKSHEKLEYQAHHDALTGLPNRQLFHDRLSMALSRAIRHDIKLAVLFLDLDNFKIVNDTLGHRTGDLLLQGVAERLSKICREEDTVARLGGDEFIILMSDLNDPVENAARLARRIIEDLNRPFQLSENEYATNVSIGVTFFPEDGDSAEDLIKFADMAMYKAKNEGKNQFALFTDEMNQNMLSRVSLESDLRQAIKRNEFELYYQPKVNIDTGFLSGAEALIRWNRNGTGLVPPDEFIPIAEETGAISEIGTWVLYRACEQTQAWRNSGYGDLSVAVNLSPKQILNDPIQSIVEEVLSATGLPPESLTLEITENIMVFDVEKTIATMERISEIGVHWSMDDFGTGYSSIRYLQRLPLNEMKIDRSFVKDIPENEASSKIVLSTVALASSFGLKVVAEGVENDSHLKFLSACRCNEAQGYLFSKPLPPEAFEHYLEQYGKMNWIDYIVAAS